MLEIRFQIIFLFLQMEKKSFIVTLFLIENFILRSSHSINTFSDALGRDFLVVKKLLIIEK